MGPEGIAPKSEKTEDWLQFIDRVLKDPDKIPKLDNLGREAANKVVDQQFRNDPAESSLAPRARNRLATGA
jgi:hypothetical protein